MSAAEPARSASRHGQSEPYSSHMGRGCGTAFVKIGRPKKAVVVTLMLLMIGTSLNATETGTAIPRTAGRADDAIAALAIASSDEGLLHVVWQEGSHRDLRYVKGQCVKGAWSRPVTVLPAIDGPMRLLADESQLYLLIGPRLTLLVSTDKGESWSNRGEILDTGPPASALDALLVGDSLMVAYTVPPHHPEAHAKPRPQLLRIARKSTGATGRSVTQTVAYAPVALAELSGGPVRGPVLVELGDALHLLYAVNIRQSQPAMGPTGQPVQVDSVSGQIFALQSNDRGVKWTAPKSVMAERVFPRSPAVEALAVGTSADGLELFVAAPSALGLRHIRQVPGSGWSDPGPVLPAPQSSLAAAFEVRDVQVASTNKGAVVVWIDTRHRSTERRIWNPLGGFPWSDDPDGADNDVFAMSLDALKSGRGEKALARLTDPGGYADQLRVASGPTETFVVWSGRARVGRRPTGVGTPPEIFCAALPSHPADPQ